VTAVVDGIARVAAPFRATLKQRELAKHWKDPDVKTVLIGGAIRSGKTQAAARLIVETAIEQPAVYLVARSTYRELEDSTKKALLYGDGNMPPLIPPELIDAYRASDNVVKLKTGAEILFRSLEESQVGKVMNLTLGGVFIDQIEELDGGEAGERIFDTLLGRLSDPRGPRKLIAVANPGGMTHWVHRRLVDEQTRDGNARYVHVTLRDNAHNLEPDYVHEMYKTQKTRPAWYRSFVLGEWGAFEGAAFNEFDSEIHIVEPFEQVPESWGVFQSLDHGFNHPTAILTWLADDDGNLIVVAEYSKPGLVSKHAAEIKESQQDIGAVEIFADPSVFASQGLQDRPGTPASVASEYAKNGIKLEPANNDRVAGYGRLLELLHVEEGRIPPPWSQVRENAGGAPRLFVFSTCKELIRQLKSAPVSSDGSDPGEAVDKKWESEHGHCVASLRYGAMAQAGHRSIESRRKAEAAGRHLDELMAWRRHTGESRAMAVWSELKF
jgi:PBSX family phage terminase large subunit